MITSFMNNHLKLIVISIMIKFIVLMYSILQICIYNLITVFQSMIFNIYSDYLTSNKIISLHIYNIILIGGWWKWGRVRWGAKYLQCTQYPNIKQLTYKKYLFSFLSKRKTINKTKFTCQSPPLSLSRCIPLLINIINHVNN